MLSVNEALSEDEDAIGIGRKGTIDKPFLLKAPFWTVDTLFYAIPKIGYDLNFMFNIFQNVDWKKKDESTGVPSLSKNTITQTKIVIPDENEQKQIGEFFKKFHDTIELHQRKLDRLKQLKEAYLESLFPSLHSFIPKLRLKNYQDDWKSYKLGNLFLERTERSAKGELLSVTINSGVLRASELTKVDNSSADKSNYKKVNKGDIVYNSMRMWQGASGYSSYEGIVSPAYTVLIPNKNVDSLFFSYMFKKYEMIKIFEKNSQGLTSDTWNLKFPALSSIKVKIPSYSEQQEISSLLLVIDESITIYQKKIKTLANLKQAYLQKMFV